MFKFIFSLAVVFTMLAFSCGTSAPNGSGTTQNPSNDSTRLPPVETKAPNTSYKPAFAGQTRIGGVRTKTPYEGVVLTSALNKPWGIGVLPDGRLLITQKKG